MKTYEEPVEPKLDESLAENIKSILSRIESISCKHITIRVSSGKVFLEGKVRSEQERNLVRHCIHNLPGVKNVANYLTFPRKLK